MSPYWENKNTHFLNLQDYTHTPLYLSSVYIWWWEADWNEVQTSEIAAKSLVKNITINYSFALSSMYR